MDHFDKKLLSILQTNGRMSNVELSDAVNLSESACLRRVKSLEERGFIDKYVALLDQKKALQEKLKQTTDDVQKTQIESDISKLDIEIEKIRQIEKQEEANEA